MKRVLICPLDWGLGHATRCVPVVNELQRMGVEVLVGSSGGALELLKQEFPPIKFFELPPYRPTYSKLPMSIGMLMQLPRFKSVIQQEHSVVQNLVLDQKVDAVISDNRYGCWSSEVKSVLITHQPAVLTPKGAGWVKPVINFLIKRSIGKFNEVWIPDQKESGVTGAFANHRLSHQKYIGWLSRFRRQTDVEIKYDIMALVSGPDPQRAAFEKLLTEQLTSLNLKSLLVAGLPGDSGRRDVGSLEIVNHMKSSDLEEAMASSSVVISRSGYSTIMDLMAMGKKAIFIPTPGQPEQIYLADYFHKKKIAYAASQGEFSVERALKESSGFSGFSNYHVDASTLTKALNTLFA